jgi:ureidoglycolate hydrolase
MKTPTCMVHLCERDTPSSQEKCQELHDLSALARFMLIPGRLLVGTPTAGAAEMNAITVVDLTPQAFAPFGTVGVPQSDGAHSAGDVPLDLSQGRPRFYIMRLAGRGELTFDRLARHDRVTQCLGTTDGLPWLIAVAPAGVQSPSVQDLTAFRIPPDRFILLAHGTWHAGPYFAEPSRDFYNLELRDTNKADFTVCHLAEPVGFAP